MTENEMQSTEGSNWDLGKEIVGTLAELKPDSSFSFILSENGHRAVQAVYDLTESDMPGNMPRLQEAALEVLKPLFDDPAGTPLNVNLDENDVKAMGKVLELIERQED